MGAATQILVVEHAPELAAPIVEQLTVDGYSVALAHTAQHASALAAISEPALVILGCLDSPHGALELLSRIRGDDAPWPSHLPVIVLGTAARPLDLLRAFDAGADDVYVLPRCWSPQGEPSILRDSMHGEAGIHYLELRARIHALLRRALAAAEPPLLRIGPLRIDTGSRAVHLHHHPIHLRPREYALLLHLAREPTRVFSKPDLLRSVWDFQAPSCTRTLDSHACRLRHKLAAHAREPWVLSIRGVGYRLTR